MSLSDVVCHKCASTATSCRTAAPSDSVIKCLRKLSRVECDYCRIVTKSNQRLERKKKRLVWLRAVEWHVAQDFHQLAADAEAKLAPTCHECSKKARQLGAPSACDYCGVRAAWSGGKCSRCSQFELEVSFVSILVYCVFVC
jgi:hypothetical protein